MKRRQMLIPVLAMMFLVLAAGPVVQTEPTTDFDSFFADAPEPVKQIATAGAEVTQVEATSYSVGSAQVSGSMTLQNTYTGTRTIFFAQVSLDSATDDAGDGMFTFYWNSATSIKFARGTSGHAATVYLHVVEFDSGAGVYVTHLYLGNSAGATSIGRTVTMASTFVIPNGYTATDAYTTANQLPHVYLSSTTQVTVTNMGGGDRWSNARCQVVEVSGSSVQRGSVEFATATDTYVDASLSAITIAESIAITQVSDDTANNLMAKYYAVRHTFTSTTNLRIYRWTATQSRQPDVRWEVIDWPSTVSVQRVSDAFSSGDTSEATPITEVDPSLSVAISSGSFVTHFFGGGYQVTSDESYEDTCIRSNFTSTTEVTSYRGVSGVSLTFYAQVIEFTSPNAAPTNDATAVLANPPSGDHLLARYTMYLFTSNHSDADGYDDIDYIELRLYDYGSTTLIWSVRYTQSTGAFSEQTGSTLIQLFVSQCVAYESGNDIDIEWRLKIEWLVSQPYPEDNDLYSYVIDDQAASDGDSYDSNLNLGTRLLHGIGTNAFDVYDASGTADRGDYNTVGVATADGRIGYTNLPIGIYDVPANETDVWISCADVAGSPWSDLSLSDDWYSVSVDSDDVVGLDTYTMTIVPEGEGVGGTRLYSGDIKSATYIADRAQVQSYSYDNARVNINTAAGDHVTIYYDYDNSYLTDGTVTVNGVSASYSGSLGVWDFGDTKSSVQAVTYDTIAVTGNTHGITTEDQNGQSILQIWDQVRVVSYTIVTPSGDNRNDIGTTYTIDVELHYDYDETDVVDGAVTVNGIATTYQSLGKWRFTDSEATVMATTYNNVQATGNTEGITVEDNAVTQQVIWDRIMIITTTVDDLRVGTDTNAELRVTAYLEYTTGGTHWLGSGDTLYLDDAQMTWDGGNSWFDIARTQSTVGLYNYLVNSTSANEATYGITVVNLNGQSQDVIFDEIVIIDTGALDYRIDVDSNATIWATAQLDYDDHMLGAGDTLYSGSDEMIWNSTSSRFEVNKTYGSVAVVQWGIGNTGTEATYDITSISGVNGPPSGVIFDRIKILTTVATSDYIDHGTGTTTINVTAELEYDSHALGSGDTLYCNDTAMTWDTDHFYVVIGPFSEFNTWTFFVNSTGANEATYIITLVNVNSQEDDVATDRVIVISYSPSDDHVNIGDSPTVNVTLQFESDSTLVTTGKLGKRSYENRLKLFANDILSFDSERTDDTKYGVRGWCYRLENLKKMHKGEFGACGTALADCRKIGLLPEDFIAPDQDLTRRFRVIHSAADPRRELTQIEEDVKKMLIALPTKTTDFWVGEEYYLIMVVEKGDLVSLFEPICEEYHIPLASSKGWSNLDVRFSAARFCKMAENIGLQPVALLFYDHDPTGLNIPRFFRKNLSEMKRGTGWDPKGLIIDRFGLNKEDVDKHGLMWIENLRTSSGKEIKMTEHVREYIRQFERRKCEANAIFKSDATLEVGRRLCREAIEKYYGPDALERFKKKEQAVRDRFPAIYDSPVWDEFYKGLEEMRSAISITLEEEEASRIVPTLEKETVVVVTGKVYAVCPRCRNQFDYDERESHDTPIRCRNFFLLIRIRYEDPPDP